MNATELHTYSPIRAGRTRCITGSCKSGKTSALVSHVADLVSEGAQPSEILAVTATPTDVGTLRRRLVGAIGLPAREIEVTTARALALRILGTPRAEAATGRKARLPFPFEANVVMEDLKATGLRPKRLKEMLKFFYRGWTELSECDPDWIIYKEERLIHDAVKGRLQAARVVMEPELASLAIEYLNSHPQALRGAGFEHVAVDDCGFMSKASQSLVAMLANSSLFVTGTPDLSVEVFDSHPYPDGIAEIARRAANCTAGNLDERSETDEERRRPVAVRPFPSPAAELEGVAEMVAKLIGEGAAAEDIFIAAPNRTWERNVRESLERAGIGTCILPPVHLLGADVRYLDRCQGARVLTALSLAADADDQLAWRSWCGFGDYLAHSALLAEISHGSLLPLLEEIEARSLDGARLIRDEIELLAAYSHGRRVIKGIVEAQVAGMDGLELLDLATQLTLGGSDEGGISCPSGLTLLCEPLEGATARDMATHAREKLASPAFVGEGVRVGSYAQAKGASANVVVVTGLVNGFFPIHDYFDMAKLDDTRRERMRQKDAAVARMLSNEGAEQLILTYFREATLEEAGALDLKVERIRVKDGRRVCNLSASIFLEELL